MTQHMSEPRHPYLAFAGHTCIVRGTLPEVAREVRAALDAGEAHPILVLESATSAPVDLDLRGTPEEAAGRAAAWVAGRAGGPASALARGSAPAPVEDPSHPSATGALTGQDGPDPGAGHAAGRRGPGRPRLGVVGREVTLLPRQWDWLAAQPGGASVALRKLVEAARKADQSPQRIRRTQDTAYRFMHALSGDLPGFEEATRALYRWDLPELERLTGSWPRDVRDHLIGILSRGD
jgi:hypothetical protein